MIRRSAEASYVAIAGCSSRDWREMLNVALSRDVGTHGGNGGRAASVAGRAPDTSGEKHLR